MYYVCIKHVIYSGVFLFKKRIGFYKNELYFNIYSNLLNAYLNLILEHFNIYIGETNIEINQIIYQGGIYI